MWEGVGEGGEGDGGVVVIKASSLKSELRFRGHFIWTDRRSYGVEQQGHRMCVSVCVRVIKKMHLTHAHACP